MKRTIAFFTVVFLTGNVIAQNFDSVPPKKTFDSTTTKWSGDSSLSKWQQDSLTKNQPDTAKKAEAETLPDRVMMKDGEMVVIKNGETIKMTDEVVFPSGTVIKADGTVKKKDGSEVKLKDGQYMALPAKEDGTNKKEMEKKKKMD